MKINLVVCRSILAVIVLALSLIPLIAAENTVCPKDGDTQVTAVLETILNKYSVPAMSGAVVTHRGLLAAGAVGTRKAGTGAAVTVKDLWHLGSDTKAMTATLAGALVEKGILKWETTLGETFPELAKSMQPDLKSVTLLQLLSHQAGLRANMDNWHIFSGTGSLPEQRYAVLKKACSLKPEHKPGTKYLYANLGYVIAGAMIERITSKSWEDNLGTYILTPLAMNSTGYGGTGTPGQLDQPWSHGAGAKPMPINGPACDNPLVMAPAGCVHCSMQDWAKFIADQLRGELGTPAILKPETYKMLHTPHFAGDYALGWIVTSRGWGGGTVLTHAGCNTMNYANVWIAPKRDMAFLVCLNQGDDVAFKASDEAIAGLIQCYLKK